MKRATAIALSPAEAGSAVDLRMVPGANAPGFMLSPASQAQVSASQAQPGSVNLWRRFYKLHLYYN